MKLRYIPAVVLALGTIDVGATAAPASAELSTKALPERAVLALVFSPDGQMLAAVAADGSLRLWDTAGRERARIAAESRTEDHPRCCLAFTADGRSLVVSDTGGVRVLDLPALKKRQRFDLPAGSPGLALSADGRRLATADDAGIIHLWDVATAKEFRRIAVKGHEPVWETIVPVAFSPDGKVLATLYQRKTSIDLPGAMYQAVHIWEVATGQRIAEMETGAAVVVGHDGRTVATAGDGHVPEPYKLAHGDFRIRLWDFTTGREQHRLDAVGAVALTPDGRVLASVDAVGPVRLWDATRGKPLGEVKAARGGVTALAFSPDGKRLAAGAADGTVILSEVPASPNVDRPAVRFTAAQLDDFRRGLAGEDAARAYAAMGALLSSPSQAVGLLREHVRPVRAPEVKRLARLIADLDADEFATRQKAARELEQLGELAEPALRKLLSDNPSPEARQQAERLLANLRFNGLSREGLLAVRAVAVLEYLNTAEARRLLEELACGAAGSVLTEEAKAALQRLTAPSR